MAPRRPIFPTTPTGSRKAPVQTLRFLWRACPYPFKTMSCNAPDFHNDLRRTADPCSLLPVFYTESSMSYLLAIDQLAAMVPELYSRPGQPRRKFSLDEIGILLAALENPHRRFPSVLIAGTNGKGSTAATLASILTASGLRTGLLHLAPSDPAQRTDPRRRPGNCRRRLRPALLSRAERRPATGRRCQAGTDAQLF